MKPLYFSLPFFSVILVFFCFFAVINRTVVNILFPSICGPEFLFGVICWQGHMVWERNAPLQDSAELFSNVIFQFVSEKQYTSAQQSTDFWHSGIYIFSLILHILFILLSESFLFTSFLLLNQSRIFCSLFPLLLI